MFNRVIKAYADLEDRSLKLSAISGTPTNKEHLSIQIGKELGERTLISASEACRQLVELQTDLAKTGLTLEEIESLLAEYKPKFYEAIQRASAYNWHYAYRGLQMVCNEIRSKVEAQQMVDMDRRFADMKALINTVAEATDGKYEANRLQGPGTDDNPSGLWIREKDENGEYTGDYIPFEDSPDAENIKPYPPDVKVQSVGQYLMSKVNKTPVKTKSTPPPSFDDLPDEALNRRGRKMRAKRNKKRKGVKNVR